MCESSTPTYLPRKPRSVVPRESHEADPRGVHKCVQTAVKLGRFVQTIRPTLPNLHATRGIFVRFPVLTTSCLFARCPLAPPCPLFPISISNGAAPHLPPRYDRHHRASPRFDFVRLGMRTFARPTSKYIYWKRVNFFKSQLAKV